MIVKSQSKIRARLTRWFFLAACLPLLSVSVIIYVSGKEDIKTAAILKLSGIRDLKVNELRQWLNERKGDTKTLAEAGDVRSLEFLRSGTPRSPDETGFIGHVRTALKNTLRFYNAYSEILLIDPRGRVVISTRESSEGLDKSRYPYFSEAVRGRETHIEDIHLSDESNKQTMSFSRPVYCRQHAGEHLLGVMVLRVDLDRSLYPLLLQRVGLGNTGETLIVNRDAVVLNDLRWYKDAPHKLKINAKPAVKAAAGKTGVIESKDYRSEPVLAAFTSIPETGWGFVAKQDQREVYLRIDTLLRNLLIIIICLTVVSYMLSIILARSISRPILKVIEAAQSIRDGALDVHISEDMEGEFKVLAGVFNAMVKSLSSERRLEADILDLNGILVTETDLKTMGRKILEKLIDCTGSAFGTFYMINKDTGGLELVFSSGLDREKLKSVDPEIIRGALNAACEFQKIIYLDKIPEDTFFMVNTVAGNAVPRSMLTIPVLIKGAPRAVISLGSLNEYSEETRDLLKRVHSTMNAGISNIISGEEIQRLASILDLNNAELESQTAELKASAEELQKQNRTLAMQRREVEEAGRLKSEFLSNMSHELRTPLNSVLALSSVLKMQSAGKLDSEEMSYLDIIERNGRQLLRLINDILDISKIEAGRMEVEAEVFSPKVTIENILETIEPLCRQKNLALEVSIPDGLPMIKSDERKLFHIVQNILSNAVKFTEKGKISVSVRFEGKIFSMTVSDTGIGIKGENLENIFLEFKQVEGSTARRYEGTGLGLAIARKAARLLGGELCVESEYGKGTTFTLNLPLMCDAPEPLETVRDENVSADRAPVVILVDDDLEFLKAVSDYLSGDGFNVITAASGRAALELAERYRPMAIVLDILMPELDGWEVLDRLKKNPATAGIPVIIVSVTKERDTGFALGAVGHLTKPVKKVDLLSEIRRLCFRPITVMVVDDNDFDRNNMVKAVERENIHAVAVSNGTDCIRLVKKSRPDLLVLDLMMPDMDGFTVLSKLRSEASTSGLPVIVVTARDLVREERDWLNLNLVTFFEKNRMTLEKLVEAVRTNLGRIEAAKFPYRKSLSAVREILVVEDNESSVIQIKSILEREGYRVHVARGGREAVQFVSHTVPDAIIMDLMMPEMDGFELLDNMRGHAETRLTPVLVLTAKDLTGEDLSRLKENNIFQLVRKGDVKREDLVSKVKCMLLTRGKSKYPQGVIPPVKKAAVPKKISLKVKSGDKPRILVIEDNPDNMRTVKAILKNKFEIIEAFNGETGIKMAVKDSPSLILLDISLPGMDGFCVINRLRDNEKTGKIPVIAITAHAMTGDREKILEAGFSDIICKPIIPKKMLEKMNDIFIT